MRVLFLLLLVACQSGHDVRIRLGPTDDTLSQGFRCVDAAGNELYLKTQISTMPPKYQFAIVVDIIGLGDTVPGCRAEELIPTCMAGDCKRLSRSCHVVTIEVRGGDTPETILAKLREQLSDFVVDRNAPDEPVIIRVIAVDLPDALPETQSECPATLPNVPSSAVGCAYSCPVQLDDVDEVFVSLDTLTPECGKAVEICAGFLPN